MRREIVKAQIALLAVGQACAAEISFDFKLQLPAHKPAWAQKLSPLLAGFSIEMDRWPDWAGSEIGKPNEYFNQLLVNLGERTGHMPALRVGANSEDRATVDLQFQVMNATYPAPTVPVPNPEASKIYIGRDFYALSGNLPAGTSFMWGINMALVNETETVAQARLLAETFQGSRANLTKDVKLVSVEIGNEPDFFGPTRFGYNGPLGLNWDYLNYTATWAKFAKAIGTEIDFGCPSSGKPSLSPGAFADYTAPGWTPQGVLEAGLLDDPTVQNKTFQITEHTYSAGYNPAHIVRVGELMDKKTVRANMSSRATSRQAVQATGLKYILAETNSYANHGTPGLSNTAESAVWGTDWLLLGASVGIEQMHFHHGIGYRYNTIQPVANSDDGLNITRPHILPLYHALLIVNEAVGKSGSSYVAELATPNVTMAAYAIWEDKRLARVVVLNTQVYLGDGDKPSINVQLAGLGAGHPATVKYLLSGKTTDHTGLTWAGQSFETESGKPSGTVTEENLTNGSFNLPASSVALVTFQKESL